MHQPKIPKPSLNQQLTERKPPVRTLKEVGEDYNVEYSYAVSTTRQNLSPCRDITIGEKHPFWLPLNCNKLSFIFNDFVKPTFFSLNLNSPQH